MTFAKGASFDDPSGLFNPSLDGNVRSAVDFHEGDKIDETALKVIRAAGCVEDFGARYRRRRPLAEEPKGGLKERSRPPRHDRIVANQDWAGVIDHCLGKA